MPGRPAGLNCIYVRPPRKARHTIGWWVGGVYETDDVCGKKGCAGSLRSGPPQYSILPCSNTQSSARSYPYNKKPENYMSFAPKFIPYFEKPIRTSENHGDIQKYWWRNLSHRQARQGAAGGATSYGNLTSLRREGLE